MGVDWSTQGVLCIARKDVDLAGVRSIFEAEVERSVQRKPSDEQGDYVEHIATAVMCKIWPTGFKHTRDIRFETSCDQSASRERQKTRHETVKELLLSGPWRLHQRIRPSL